MINFKNDGTVNTNNKILKKIVPFSVYWQNIQAVKKKNDEFKKYLF